MSWLARILSKRAFEKSLGSQGKRLPTALETRRFNDHVIGSSENASKQRGEMKEFVDKMNLLNLNNGVNHGT